jgi:hypothetical protein
MFFSFSFSYNVTYLVFLVVFSMFHQVTAFTRRWLLALLWALVARVCGRREVDLLEAILIGGSDGGDNGGGGNAGSVIVGGAKGSSAPVRPEGQAAAARLTAQRNNAPLAAAAQPFTSRAAIGAERRSQESQAAQWPWGSCWWLPGGPR